MIKHIRKEFKDKLDSLSDEEIHNIICKALESANVPILSIIKRELNLSH